jgi:NAD(P)-dependent dehydrogenase (short-subunit alcohol dehydrogenase family)
MNRDAGAAVVTGASTGIGRATALALAKAGYQVFAGVRKDADAVALRETGERVVPVHIDVTDACSVATAAKQVEHAVGGRGLAALVNNAGVGFTGPMEVFPVDALRTQYEVNVFGQVVVIQAFLPLLRRGAGRMINIGSIGDRLTIPFGGPLASSKWPFASITEALRLELRPWGIHVVLIEPASIHTDAVGKVAADAERMLQRLDRPQLARYAEAYRRMIRRTIAKENAGSRPEAVASVIVRALTARRPRTRYLAGKDARTLAFIARWAPDRLFDRIRTRLFGLPRRFGGMRARDPDARPSAGAGRQDPSNQRQAAFEAHIRGRKS